MGRTIIPYIKGYGWVIEDRIFRDRQAAIDWYKSYLFQKMVVSEYYNLPPAYRGGIFESWMEDRFVSHPQMVSDVLEALSEVRAVEPK